MQDWIITIAQVISEIRIPEFLKLKPGSGSIGINTTELYLYIKSKINKTDKINAALITRYIVENLVPWEGEFKVVTFEEQSNIFKDDINKEVFFEELKYFFSTIHKIKYEELNFDKPEENEILPSLRWMPKCIVVKDNNRFLVNSHEVRKITAYLGV